MALSRSDVLQARAAKAAARAAGLFVVEKPGRFLIYRALRPRNVFIDQAATVADLARAIAVAARTAPSHPQPGGAS